MPSQPQLSFITPEEYLRVERKADSPSEYFDGEIFAMAGASKEHNLIVGNAFAELHGQIKKRPCHIYSNDMRVKVSLTGLYTYPDIVAVCGKEQFDDKQKDTLLNPTLIIEVLSDSTEAYDRGEKFKQYRQLDSLMEYVLIAQHKHSVEHYVRQSGNQWVFSETDDLQDIMQLSAINCHLTLSDIYDKVEINAQLQRSV
ncbi:MAG: Uma2 family endonuclease [Candidatus Parabeggiatoa sp. nov. 1]|nr:MAG: Uma2 family endonuclease [Gammaproteobacteria bacterium]